MRLRRTGGTPPARLSKPEIGPKFGPRIGADYSVPAPDCNHFPAPIQGSIRHAGVMPAKRSAERASSGMLGRSLRLDSRLRASRLRE